MTLAERRQRLQKRREAFVVKHVLEFLRSLTPDKMAEIVAMWSQRTFNREHETDVFESIALLTAFGSTKRADYVDGGEAWKDYDSLCQLESVRRGAAALATVVQVWIKRLNVQNGQTVTAQAEDARRMCRMMGINFVDLLAEARRAIPQPKSWAACEEPDPPPIAVEPHDEGEPPFDPDPSQEEIEDEATVTEAG